MHFYSHEFREITRLVTRNPRMLFVYPFFRIIATYQTARHHNPEDITSSST